MSLITYNGGGTKKINKVETGGGGGKRGIQRKRGRGALPPSSPPPLFPSPPLPRGGACPIGWGSEWNK